MVPTWPTPPIWGVIYRYQQHEIPLVSVTVTQYDQHTVVCPCGRVHTAPRPEGAGAGRVEYGLNLRAWAVYLLVRRRKTLVICRRCHEDIHAGRGTAPLRK